MVINILMIMAASVVLSYQVATRCAALAASQRTPPLATLSGGSRHLRHGRRLAIIRTTGSLDYQGTSIHPFSRRTVSFSMLQKNLYKKFYGTPCPASLWKRMPPVLIVCCMFLEAPPPSLTAALRIKATHRGTKAMGSACGP